MTKSRENDAWHVVHIVYTDLTKKGIDPLYASCLVHALFFAMLVNYDEFREVCGEHAWARLNEIAPVPVEEI
jgi:hypothetical protein